MAKVHAWAAHAAKQKLEPYTFDPGPLGSEEVEIAVEYCGLCHSDVSMIRDEWGMARYPLIPGHEIVGRVVALGDHARGLMAGQRVGVGWNAGSCMHCQQCMTGQHNLCAEAVPTIVGHSGGFAERIRTHWAWTIPLPGALDMSSAGPLFCAGVTVFAPLSVFGVKPTDRVGVVGIGGLGHLALRFANAWGCEVTAFTSHASKADEAKGFGAHHVVSSRDSEAIRKLAGTLDFLLVTVNVSLDWSAMMVALRPNGRLHVVGAIVAPLTITAMDLIFGQKRVSGSPTGAPAVIASMLDFAARHKIAPQVEHFPMSKVNEAVEHLMSGKARYRIVLDPDFQ